MRQTGMIAIALGLIAGAWFGCGGPDRTKSTGLPLSGTSSSSNQDAGSTIGSTADAGEGSSGPGDAGQSCAFGFKAPVSYAADGGPVSIVAADFNHDGHQDIAMDITGDVNIPGYVMVYFGHGDGTLSQPTVYSGGGYSLDVADFNGDGHPDLALGTYPVQSIQILLNQGDGTFTPGPGIPQTIAPERPFMAADLNGDGLADVVVDQGLGGFPSGLLIYLNAGNGTFDTPQSFPDVSGGEQVADTTGNGRNDIVVVFNGSTPYAGIGVLPNRGNGMFGPLQTIAPTPEMCSSGLVFANLAGASPLDAIAACENQGGSMGTLTVSLFQGGTWAAPTVYPVDSPTHVTNPIDSASNPVVADFNGDGKLDIIVGDTFDPVLDLFLGNGDGTFRTARRIPLKASSGTIVAVDLNGDGWPDLVVGDGSNGGSLDVLLNNGCNP